MISGRDIIYISSIEWHFLWQVHQEIALRLARAGNRVLYVENMGVRAPGLRDARRVASRLTSWARSLQTSGVREVAPNVYVYSPLILPPFGPLWQRQLNRRVLLPVVARAARRLGMRDPLLWTYLPTNSALDLLRLLRSPQSAQVYYCVADFSKLAPHATQLRRSERLTVESSDVVFTNCAQLAAYCGRWNENVHVFPPGVDLEAFPLLKDVGEDAAVDSQEAAGETVRVLPEALSRPVVGYVGGLHRYVDVRLLVEMGRARPDWSWVFVGALQTNVGELSELPNVRLVGQRPHEELARHISGFDVCLVPYVVNDETETVVPVKINEYLAMGKPVVSTPLPTVCDFNDKHRVLSIAPARAESFLSAIEGALRSADDVTEMMRRREIAALADWQARLEAMSELIESAAVVKTSSREGIVKTESVSAAK